MKTISFIFVAATALLTGCGDKSSSSSGTNTTSSGGNLATAPADYLNTAVKAEQNAVKLVDTTSLDKAVQLFNVDKGRNPKDLNELVEQKYYPKIPEVPYGYKLAYDANSGKVSVVKQ
jgi:hypothetical protein